MLRRTAIAPLVLLALAVASPWNCSSHQAIVLLRLADAGAEADATLATTDSDTPAGPDAPTGAATDTPPPPPADALVSPAADAVESPPADALPSPPADATPSAGLPFRDDFTSGWAAHWRLSPSEDGPVTNVSDGTLAMVTLDATDASYSRLRCNLDGSLFSETDLAATMRFRVDQAPVSTQLVRLDVRQAAKTENIFYAVGAKVDKDGSITKVGIYKKVAKNVEAGASEYTICSLAERTLTTPVPLGQWRTLKLTVSGTNIVSLAAFFEDQEMARYVDGCVSELEATDGAKVTNGGCLADQTGLGIQVEAGIKATVDYVLVTTP